MHMLWSESESDHPGGNPAEEWKPCDHPEHERWRELVRAAEDFADDAILDEELHPLRHAGRPLAPILHQPQVFRGEPTSA